MGNVFSPSISCDSSISRCLDCSARKAGYLFDLEENFDALEKELQMLIEVRNDVKIRIIIAEQQQMKRLEQVQGWLSRVQDIETQLTYLRETDRVSYRHRYKFGKYVFEKLLEVQSLRDQGDHFTDVALLVPDTLVDERPLPPTVVGLQSTLDTVWRCLMGDHMGIVGLYGMGGVGKTTLLTQINNKFHDTPNSFDFVIWTVVSKDLQLEKIQESIAKKIGVSFGKSWNDKDFDEKAQEIFKILSNKKFVLLLDDLWELVDLAQVGVPVPSSTSASYKIVFTTREFEVCGHMEAHKSLRVECLRYEDAWKLFEEKVGKEILDGHPDIPELAETVAKECGGLPLALITVGRAMASKNTPREWEHAIEVLRSSTSKFSGMESRVFSRLKLSYDFLPSNAARICLLNCSLFPEDYRISIEDLIDWWICEEFLDDYDGIEARNQGYSIIRVLIHACLLEEEEDNYVKMHDVIRDMALWIASTFDMEKEKFLVLAGVRLTKAPKIEMWKEVTRMSLMKNKIKDLLQSPTSPQLLSLLLSDNSLYRIDRNFFQSMASLRVLKLSNTSPPDDSLIGISKLVSLEHLDLSNSGIERLPEELRYLVNLKCLNLENTHKLNYIPRKVISNLKMLRSLRMYGCCGFRAGDSDVLVEELLGLEHLSYLTLTLHSFQALERLLNSPLLKSTRISSLLFNYSQSRMYLQSLSVFFVARLSHLQTIRLEDNDLEEIMTDFSGKVKEIRAARGFHSLHKVSLSRCRLMHVTWLILAPNLKYLEIEDCMDLEEVINRGKLEEVAAAETEVMEHLIPFGRLEYLSLRRLQKLKSIHSTALPFSRLKEISVQRCPGLKKLPLDRNITGLESKIVIKGTRYWWNELQWDDEATQIAFLPFFKDISETKWMPSDSE